MHSQKYIYILSNRQKKELLVRGKPIRIALPAPAIEPPDLLAWAKSVLPAELRPHVAKAEEEELMIYPSIGRGSPNDLTEVIGHIQHNHSFTWGIVVIAVVATLQPVRRTTAKPLAVQWPANVRIGGRPLIGGEDPSSIHPANQSPPSPPTRTPAHTDHPR